MCLPAHGCLSCLFCCSRNATRFASAEAEYGEASQAAAAALARLVESSDKVPTRHGQNYLFPQSRDPYIIHLNIALQMVKWWFPFILVEKAEKAMFQMGKMYLLRSPAKGLGEFGSPQGFVGHLVSSPIHPSQVEDRLLALSRNVPFATEIVRT